MGTLDLVNRQNGVEPNQTDEVRRGGCSRTPGRKAASTRRGAGGAARTGEATLLIGRTKWSQIKKIRCGLLHPGPQKQMQAARANGCGATAVKGVARRSSRATATFFIEGKKKKQGRNACIPLLFFCGLAKNGVEHLFTVIFWFQNIT